jgi:hypothetical protein
MGLAHFILRPQHEAGVLVNEGACCPFDPCYPIVSVVWALVVWASWLMGTLTRKAITQVNQSQV